MKSDNKKQELIQSLEGNKQKITKSINNLKQIVSKENLENKISDKPKSWLLGSLVTGFIIGFLLIFLKKTPTENTLNNEISDKSINTQQNFESSKIKKTSFISNLINKFLSEVFNIITKDFLKPFLNDLVAKNKNK